MPSWISKNSHKFRSHLICQGHEITNYKDVGLNLIEYFLNPLYWRKYSSLLGSTLGAVGGVQR